MDTPKLATLPGLLLSSPMKKSIDFRHPRALETFAKLVAAKEREACAKLCDSFQARDVGMQPAECAGAIRAKGEA